jgi:hypothetical protein
MCAYQLILKVNMTCNNEPTFHQGHMRRGGKVTYDPDGKLKLMLSDKH